MTLSAASVPAAGFFGARVQIRKVITASNTEATVLFSPNP